MTKEPSPPFNLVSSPLTSKPVFSKTNCPINCKTNESLKPPQKIVTETTKNSSPTEKLSDVLNTSQPTLTDTASKSAPMPAATSTSAAGAATASGGAGAGCQLASNPNVETLHKSTPVCNNFDVSANPVISNGSLMWEKDSSVISQLSSFFKNCHLQDNYSQGSVCPSQQIRTELYPPKSYSVAYQTPISESSPTTQRDRLHLTLFLH
uniref:Uncharacterized protein n=1 Tax=Octopus bimaculoides TaxID=37653 RepID=A0A0L8GYZ0_OCTBM|eukprot:XP_014776875.1 PREDICTED: uncharacterized protein LOC106873872 [Octopus bimaculoides]